MQNPHNLFNETIKVLLVDGQASSATLLQEQIGDRAEFHFDWQKDYNAALNACLSGQYHIGLIGSKLSDLHGEEQKGVEFIQEAKNKDCQIPLLYLTSDDQLETISDRTLLDSIEILTKEQVGEQGLQHCLWSKLQGPWAEREFQSEKDRFNLIINCVKNGIVLVRSTGGIDYMNIAAEKLLGVSIEDVIGQPLLNHLVLMDEVYKVDLFDDIVERLEGRDSFQFGPDVLLRAATGEELPVKCTFTPIFSGGVNGSKTHVVIIEDISEIREFNRKLAYEATHDQLTGLPNRVEFEKSIQDAIENAHEHDQSHCVLYIDVDQFKVINDTCGHLAGDELLLQLSDLVKRSVRRRDTFTRLGGDEFGIVLWRCELEDGERIARQIMEDVSDFRFQWNDKSFAVSFSIGMAKIDRTSMTWAEVLSVADSACYEAKENGRNRIHIADAEDPQTAKRFSEMEWVAELIQGLEEGGFQFFKQEIRSLHDDEAQGENYEILLRYADRTEKIHLPESFLPAAERYNIITMVDRWVVSNLIDWLKASPEQLEAANMISINLSGVTIQDDKSLDYFYDLLKHAQIDLSKICFEVTETAAVSFINRANYFIQKIRELGCSFALDDFGAGMSSFAYLKHLPVDYIKIDGGFVKNIYEDPVDYSLVQSINQIAHIMGKKTIATRCESDAVYQKLKEIGVDYVQGFHIARPQSLGLSNDDESNENDLN